MTDAPTHENDDTTTAAEAVPTAEAPAVEAPARPAKKAAAKKTAAKKTAAKRAPAKKAAAKSTEDVVETTEAAAEVAEAPASKPAAKKAAAKKTAAKKSAAKKTAAKRAPAKKAAAAEQEQLVLEVEPTDAPAADAAPAATEPEAPAAPALLFQPPVAAAPTARTATPKASEDAEDAEESEESEESEETSDAVDAAVAEGEDAAAEAEAVDADESEESEESDDEESAEDGEGAAGTARRRRRRGGRRRRKPGQGQGAEGDDGDDTGDEAAASDADAASDAATDAADGGEDDDAEGGESADGGQGGSSSSRRRRRRRRSGEAGADEGDDENTVVRVRKPRNPEDEITAVSGSTRLEAKKQRRREGREAGRRRAPIVSEAEFLARRESVERVMAVRQRKDLTQIAVIEDKVLVEHYVARESQTSMIGNVYLGRVQNVLPSMEAAFIDIGKGRNAVLYAGEVNWSALGHKDGQPRKIESVLQSGQTVLVQVTKDPIGHKGARLTSQVSLAGRFLVYVPDGTTSGISRKLPDTERARLKALLKEIVPETAGVIVRTAAEGASEEELTRDVERLKARWDDIEAKIAKGNAPQLLYGEPDLTLKVVRDLFTEDFSKLVVQGDDVWATVKDYVEGVAPDLVERLEHHVPDAQTPDLFAVHRIDEQIAKGLDRKVWLPSGGSLIIDRTEAMTVVDVNTGKFTGSGGNLEETVTKNNLEAAEEIVRQLRLRDIGGIIVVDFIDMVLESNRDLVLRRLVECLGRDRTRHQVAEVTSLGLVQMTRKRIGTGLVEAFSENCTHCQGRGIVVHELPVEPKRSAAAPAAEADGERRGRRRRGRGGVEAEPEAPKPVVPSPKDVAAMARHEAAAEGVDESADEGADQGADEIAADSAVVETVETVEPAAVVEPEPTLEPEPEPAAEPEPEPEPAPEPTPEPTPEPEVPAAGTRVTTRTRRAAATRPAGQPAEVPAPIVVAAPAAVVTPDADTPAPTVTTRTRTRTARTVTPVATEADPGAVDGDGATVEHVPIKKKGGPRKR